MGTNSYVQQWMMIQVSELMFSPVSNISKSPQILYHIKKVISERYQPPRRGADDQQYTEQWVLTTVMLLHL